MSLCFSPLLPQDQQRDWPSLPDQGPEEGRVLPTAGPVQPPPQEQPQRKAVSAGGRKKALSFPLIFWVLLLFTLLFSFPLFSLAPLKRGDLGWRVCVFMY